MPSARVLVFWSSFLPVTDPARLRGPPKKSINSISHNMKQTSTESKRTCYVCTTPKLRESGSGDFQRTTKNVKIDRTPSALNRNADIHAEKRLNTVCF